MPPEATAEEPEETTDETADESQNVETDEQQTETDSSGDESLLEQEANESTEADYTDNVPDHMVQEDGSVDTQELYKSYQGLVREVPDAEVPTEDVIDENGQINEEKLVEQRTKLRRIQSKQDGEDEDTDTDDEQTEVDESEVPESPDEYDIEIDDESVDVNEEAIEIAKEAGHDAEMTQKQLENFVKNYESKIAEQQQANREEELKKISDDPQQAKKILSQTNDWLQGLHEQGHLSEEELNKARQVGNDAAGVNLFRRFQQLTKDNPIPVDTGTSTGESIDDLKAREKEIMNKDGYYESGHPEHERLNREADRIRDKINKMENG